MMYCPCNKSNLYLVCCGAIHKNIFLAKTAEQLMRSRYSAFVLNNMDYLKLSHSSKTVKSFNFKNTSKWTKQVQWIKLDILNTEYGLVNDISGFVEFKAYFKENGFLEYIHGKSTFEIENNHWVYLDEI
jgi:SEC-C motif-containing protein